MTVYVVLELLSLVKSQLLRYIIAYIFSCPLIASELLPFARELLCLFVVPIWIEPWCIEESPFWEHRPSSGHFYSYRRGSHSSKLNQTAFAQSRDLQIMVFKSVHYSVILYALLVIPHLCFLSINWSELLAALVASSAASPFTPVLMYIYHQAVIFYHTWINVYRSWCVSTRNLANSTLNYWYSFIAHGNLYHGRNLISK